MRTVSTYNRCYRVQQVYGQHQRFIRMSTLCSLTNQVHTNLNKIFRLLLLLPEQHREARRYLDARPTLPRYCYFRLREPNKLRCFESWDCIMRDRNVGDIQIHGKHQCMLDVPVKAARKLMLFVVLVEKQHLVHCCFYKGIAAIIISKNEYS